VSIISKFISVSLLLTFNVFANESYITIIGDKTILDINQDGINNSLNIDIYNYSNEYSTYEFIQTGDNFSYTFSQTCYSTCGVTITQQ